MTDETLIAPAGSSTVNAEDPWPGLLPFLEADRNFFRGRDAETGELSRLVMRERLTVLFGVSGLGKSSLLQAGLFPVLRQQDIFPVYIRLDFAPAKPNLAAQVAQAIITQASSGEIEAPTPRAGETLWEYFHRPEADFWTPRNRPAVPLLVFDQFEEVFTLGQKDSDHVKATEEFILQLADLAEGRPPAAVEARLNEHPAQAEDFSFNRHHYKILLAIREDFLADLEGLRSRIAALALNRMRLKRMNGEAALLAVNQAPHLIDKEVAEKVVRFVAKAPAEARLTDLEVEPALLSLVCRELNNRRKDRKEAKITAGLLQAKQEEVLARFYEDSFTGLPPQVRMFVEDQLLDVEGRRNSQAVANALAAGVTREAIDRLVKRRLLRIEDLGGARLELTHDRLTEVAGASRSQRQKLEAEERERRAVEQARRTKIVAAAFLVVALMAVSAAWLASRKSQEAAGQTLIAELQAARATSQEASAKYQQSLAEQNALDASYAARLAKSAQGQSEEETKIAAASEREAIKQTGIAETATASAKAEAAKADTAAKSEAQARKDADKNAADAKASAHLAEQKTADALQAQQDLKMNLARSDVLQASSLLDEHNQPSAALVYLARALRSDPTSLAAKSFIFDLFFRGDHNSPIADALPSGARGASFVREFTGCPETIVAAASFSPDGRFIATACWDNVARLWNSETGEFVRPFTGHQGKVNSVNFSPDGHFLVTASQDNSARIWNVETGKEVHKLPHKGPVLSASFSPRQGELRVVTGSWDKTAAVWEVTGKQIGTFEHSRPVTSASISLSDGSVATGSWDGIAREWAPPGAFWVPREISQRGQINSVAFSPDGRRLVTASNDGTAQVWDRSVSASQGGRPVGAPLHHAGAVNSAAFSPDGLRIVTASDDKTARVWEAETGAPISVPLCHTDRVTSASFGCGGLCVLTSSYDKTVKIWEVRFQADPVLLANLAEAVSGYAADQLPDLLPLALRQNQTPLSDLRERAPLSWFIRQK